MADGRIQEGFEVFVSDEDKPFGAVRQVEPHGRPEMVVYVENAGEFASALGAITAVHSGKVIVDCDQLDHELRKRSGVPTPPRTRESEGGCRFREARPKGVRALGRRR